MLKLYKRNATGKVQIWCVEREGAAYRTHSGQFDGKLVSSKWTTAKPTNEGRANARDALAQAVFEVDALCKKQRKAGYGDSPESAVRGFQPMLAQHYNDRKSEIEKELFDCGVVVSQRKLDGIRCIAKADGLWSRRNTPILACPYVAEALAPTFRKFPDLILDGELYNHELSSDFNEIVSLVRKTSGLTADIVEGLKSKGVAYHIYDAVTPGSYTDRSCFVRDCSAAAASPHVTYVAHELATSLEDIDALYEQYLDENYEGQMIRLRGEYDQKRSPLLLKRKDHEDVEFVVTDITEGEGNRSGVAGRVWLRSDRDPAKTFKANPTGTVEFLAELLRAKDQYIGGEVTVRYNGRTPDGVPRFPRVVKYYPGGRDV